MCTDPTGTRPARADAGCTTGDGSAFRTSETHLSWLVLVGDLVLKAKMPVRTSFLHLTTRAARRRVADREVELNRRLAAEVHLGVTTLAGVAGLDEPVVVVRRMPDDRRLALLARQGEDLDAVVIDLAGLLSKFHRQATRTPVADPAAAALRLWTENTEQMLAAAAAAELPAGQVRLPAGQLRRVQALAERYLYGRSPLLWAREVAGWSRDGHGDLLADDIFCLPDRPRVLDCLEFDDRLRAGDVLADVAFLAMDLEHLGRPELGALLLAEHRRLLDDDWPASLADFWVGYRAQIHAKVVAIRADQDSQAGDEPAAAAASNQARRLLDLAERRLRAAQLRVVVGGAPGTSKSIVAAALGTRTGWPVLRSDVVRQILTVGPVAPEPAGAGTDGLDAGRYDPATTRRVLDELLRQAGELLGVGRSVVLNATGATASWRRAVQELAERTGSNLLCARTVLPEAVADQRLAARTATGTDASDATVQIAQALRPRFAPWPQALQLDTRRPLAELTGELLTAASLPGGPVRPVNDNDPTTPDPHPALAEALTAGQAGRTQ